MTGFGATIAKENYDKGVINTLSLFLRSGTTEKELLKFSSKISAIMSSDIF